MRSSQARAPELRLYDNEIIVDNFAGGGGASTGIVAATGRAPHLAVNHDPEALAVYKANHPETRVLCEDVFSVEPRFAVGGKRVGLAWFSPDCTFFSKARGAKPFRDKRKARKRRGLAGVALKWAEQVRPRVIFIENVEEFQHWGPIGDDGLPDPTRKGENFRRYVARWRNLGYAIEWRELRACDFGAPTTRKRLFIQCRCDGEPIAWPEPTHAPRKDAEKKGLKPYRTAAECIDWEIPCPSIFTRKKQLAEATLRRIARGIMKYVVNSPEPFIVPMQRDNRPVGVNEPLQTVTTQGNKFNVVVPVVTKFQQNSVGQAPGQPLDTVMAGATRFGVVAPILSPVKSWGGGGNDAQSADQPMRTVTTSKRGEHAVVAPILAPLTHQGGDRGQRADEPAPTVTGAHRGELAVVAPVLARLGQQNGNGAYVNSVVDPLTTVTTKAEHMVVSPTLVQMCWGEREGQAPRALDIHQPLGTVMAEGCKHGLVTALLAKHYGGGKKGKQVAGNSLSEPTGTVTAADHHALVAAHIVKLKGTCQDGQSVEEPLATVQAQGLHYAEVRALLVKYYKTGAPRSAAEPFDTVTTRDRFAVVVTVHGTDYAIVDIGMRMLTPRELYNAQGFPPGYVIDPEVDKRDAKGRVRKDKRGRTLRGKLTKTAQVHKCGNAVPPPFSEALVRAAFAARREEKTG